MFNIKWGGIAAGTAFALAFTLSLLLGQTNLPIALFRAAVFAALFFGLGTGAWALISTFIPDLLSPNTADVASSLFSTGTAGSRVNITVDDMQNDALQAALPEQDYGKPAGSAVGDFNELFSPKNTASEDSQYIDQTPATGYTTEEGETEAFASGAEGFTSAFGDAGLNNEKETGEFSMDFSAFFSDGTDGDSAANESELESGPNSEADSNFDLDAFSFFPDTEGSENHKETAVPERRVSQNKSMKLEGDFNAKEIAAGLRTVLEKDKKRG